jgi:hypothetical protein
VHFARNFAIFGSLDGRPLAVVVALVGWLEVAAAEVALICHMSNAARQNYAF